MHSVTNLVRFPEISSQLTLIHSMSVNFSDNLGLLIWVAELLHIISDTSSVNFIE